MPDQDQKSPASQSPASQSPAEAPRPGAPEPKWRSSYRDARSAFGMAVGCLAAALALGALAQTRLEPWAAPPAIFGVLAALVFLAWSGMSSISALFHMARSKDPVGVWSPLAALGMVLMAGLGVLMAFTGMMGMARGRQLRKRGKVLLPPLEPGAAGAAWAPLPTTAAIPAAARAALAARWRENGRTEHASVAAFARLTLDLMALGAPPELIEAANRDARDEIRHTLLCFSAAKALDGGDEGPGPFPEAQDARTLPSNRTLALAQLAVDSLIDGALHEGLSARLLARLAPRCEVPDLRALILELASDEAWHSAHGWDVVEWCLAEGGAPVAAALRGAAAALSSDHETDLPAEAQDGSWEPFGVHGLALEREQHERCVAAVRARVESLTRHKAVTALH